MDRIDELKIMLFDLSATQRELRRQFENTEKLKKPLLEEFARLEKEKREKK